LLQEEKDKENQSNSGIVNNRQEEEQEQQPHNPGPKTNLKPTKINLSCVGGPVVEGGSLHLAAPGLIPGVSTQPTRLGVQGCGGVHSTLTAGIIRVKGPLVVTCILRFATLGQAPNSRNV